VLAKPISARVEPVQRFANFRKLDLAGVIDRVQAFVVFQLNSRFDKIG
jgi:hypothetical protein